METTMEFITVENEFKTTRNEFTGEDWLNIIDIIDRTGCPHREHNGEKDRFVRSARRAIPKILERIKLHMDEKLGAVSEQRFQLHVPVIFQNQMEGACERYEFRIQSTPTMDAIALEQLKEEWAE